MRSSTTYLDLAMPCEENINNGAANARLSVNLTSSRRVSMDSYYGRNDQDGEAISAEPQDPPPCYEPILQIPPQLRKYNIQPREDEGRETLPAYSCAISLEGVFAKKMELEGAIHQAHDRNWYKVFVVLQGTALSVHKYKNSGFFSKTEGGRKPTADFPGGAKRGHLLKLYNLQHAEVGVAADYLKRRYVIRVRAEADQFLLSCHKIETFVLWLQSFFAAIDLAPPLDDRDLPRDLSVPRPRRRRAAMVVERNIEIMREQQEILARQFPNLAETDMPELLEETNPEEETTDEPEITPAPRPLRHQSAIIPVIMGVCSGPHGPNPNISTSTGKWAPKPPKVPWTEMQYAKRCMAILTSRSPRKSNLVIMKGRRWVIDWATGKLTKWVPPPNEGLPDYENVGLEKIMVESERDEIWSVRQYGDIVRV